jgi:hypothetical protein
MRQCIGWKGFLRASAENSNTPAQIGAAPGSGILFRFNYNAYRREAHHYAVDRFYKTYFPRKRGGEPLPEHYVDQILRLRREGLNYVVIAGRLGQPKEKMRKQVQAAEKRWRDAVERIERIKQRFPHLVAKEPAMEVRKKGVSRQRSNRRGPNRRAGK